MKKIFKVAPFVLVLLFYSDLYSQERPYRIGLKFGYPQLVGLNLEYLTPLLNNRLSFDVDVSYIPIDANANTAKLGFKNFALSSNYYFFKKGLGLYGGIGYNKTIFSWDFSSTSDPKISNPSILNISSDRFVFKVGGKHGGLFYFRWELGYGVLLSENLKINDHRINGLIENVFGSITGINCNIGFGFSF